MRSILLTLTIASAFAQSYDIALTGDTPYGVAAEPRWERAIADINRQTVDLTIHIGDTKSGSTRCDNSHYSKVLNWFNSFDSALLYSVGDNEWTDCMRTSNGAYDPLDRLALVRKTYFTNNQTLGRRPLTVIRQSQDPAYSLYVENAMIVKSPIVIAAIHIPGSNNNLEYKLNQGVPNTFYDNDKEYAARNAANLAWLKTIFETARTNKSLGILIGIQANIFEAFNDTVTGNTRSGFEQFVKALRQETLAFKGEVVLVSGDTHFMRVDKPLTDQYPACTAATGECKPFDAALDSRGNRILNFTRLEVPGSADVHWVLCHVRSNARNVFQFEFMIVPDAPAGAAVTATIAGPSTVEANGSQVVLDASPSLSSNSGPVTYSWAAEQGYPQTAILNANSATPTVQLPGRGTYRFAVTVTDRTNSSATASVAVRYQ